MGFLTVKFPDVVLSPVDTKDCFKTDVVVVDDSRLKALIEFYRIAKGNVSVYRFKDEKK